MAQAAQAKRAAASARADTARIQAARAGWRLLGAALLAAAFFLLLAFISFDAMDPSLNRSTLAAPQNWMGGAGALFADLFYQLLGFAAFVLLPLLAVTGARLVRLTPRPRLGLRILLTALAVLLAATGLGALETQALPAGPGGLAGLGGSVLADLLLAAAPGLPEEAARIGMCVLFGIAAATGVYLGLGLPKGAIAALFARQAAEPVPAAAPRRRARRAEEGDASAVTAADADALAAPPASESDDTPPRRKKRKVTTAQPERTQSARTAKERQRGLQLGDEYELPALSLLAEADTDGRPKVDEAALEQNARVLESVLEDFGVKGEIVEVRPGPVVTMYELEPAPGIKSSRVIGLADDIARSMSAVSARVAVVPGRNVIGIELPNRDREMVALSELLEDQAFEGAKGALPLVLGKNISGGPVVVDLAPMPHLLIAGTTGSGKSVGLNAMILSLLYRLPPDRCRMIMIDPKMLELSVYDGIPHLLSPVVTEPQKAVRALKWAVEQMEERYRMMAAVNVRSLAAFNQRLEEAKADGKPLERRVHTGYDPDSGQPVYETETLEFEPLPLVVVIVDELADLMMTAGKEVEFLIQRLAQKARAAGIHLIMATQRPSVDVITGVIKANLPTRISFSVTSKIDSRTILGEQGAEQLLGKGDMLYMAGGKGLTRVHGPFVSDEEVERVADHWRGQGTPDYVEAVTEEPEAELDQFGLPIGSGEGGEDGDADKLRQAIETVARTQKASTSHIQRHLRIGYNNAARLIDQLEEMGFVSAADHVGRREVLIDQSGNRL
ncbi:cell division protein FtsK [Pacificimonas flava]|uniref:DNA translocase FtsK n=2 Tax=Pacificimonas TaxID=1960290 RepID=A0A219B8B6_9SPHN|nr:MULTISPECIES: DNA translocase FtsK 4TM domain-containing protein [Pacificimonas]MBZ6377545.1 DNA translocase FtsK 4TM domain-containing protein [Pacificimonas aurantium]OWV34632.1 cell division protein FtsK [Pacificimonas flava]